MLGWGRNGVSATGHGLDILRRIRWPCGSLGSLGRCLAECLVVFSALETAMSGGKREATKPYRAPVRSVGRGAARCSSLIVVLTRGSPGTPAAVILRVADWGKIQGLG